MLCRAAEESFARGKQALEQGRRREALALFEAAIELERRQGTSTRKIQPRYLSFYGYCLAVEGRRHEGVYFCREATLQERFDPDLYCNLGRALLAAKRLRQAHPAFTAGLALQPDHPGIRTELLAMGRRQRPMLPFLGRANPVNVLLGRVFRSER